MYKSELFCVWNMSSTVFVGLDAPYCQNPAVQYFSLS